MTFNNFKDKIKEMILEHGKFSNCTLEYKDVIKNNGTKMQGILIRYGNGLAPIIYVDDFYNEYILGTTMEDIKTHLYKILDDLENNAEEESECVDIVKKMADFNFCRKNIYMKLVNAHMNKHITEPGSDVPYIMHNDLGLISIFQMSIKKSNGINSITIKNNMLDTWNITKEELKNIAEENLERDRSIRIEPIFNVLNNILPKEEKPEEIDLMSPMYVVTNSIIINGAQTMMYPDFISKVQQATGFNEFMILPSSIHELIVIPYDNENIKSMDKIIDTVADINKEEVSNDEILSNNVFYCDGMKISIAGKEGS